MEVRTPHGRLLGTIPDDPSYARHRRVSFALLEGGDLPLKHSNPEPGLVRWRRVDLRVDWYQPGPLDRPYLAVVAGDDLLGDLRRVRGWRDA